jgi:DNA-binding transcriptional regulator YiaG
MNDIIWCADNPRTAAQRIAHLEALVTARIDNSRPEPMSTAEFKCLQRRSGLNNRELAEWLGVSRRTVEDWRSNTHPIKGPAARLMRLAFSHKEGGRP